MVEHKKQLPPMDMQELFKLMYAPKVFLSPYPSLSEDFNRVFEADWDKNKYHRKTNYKPKYTL